MKPQSAKAKGRRLQQQIASDLLERFPALTADDVRSTSMGAGGEDVQLSSAARRLIPYSFEAKNQEKLNFWAAIEQARANTPANATYAVVFKKNKEKPHIIVPWSHFADLIASPRLPSDGGGAQSLEGSERTSETMQTKQSLLELASRLQALANELP